MGNIHLLAIFNIDVEVRNLERIFGQIGFDEKVLSTTKSMPEVMEIVIKIKELRYLHMWIVLVDYLKQIVLLK